MRKAALGLSVLATVLGLWALFLVGSKAKPRFKVETRKSVEAYARSLTEPAEGTQAWRLKRPYPAPDQMEQAMGKADEIDWGYAWTTKYVWRTGDGETVAWFSKSDGLLDALELNYSGVESIARDAIHYRREPVRLK